VTAVTVIHNLIVESGRNPNEKAMPGFTGAAKVDPELAGLPMSTHSACTA
jgi:hypothetical protein